MSELTAFDKLVVYLENKLGTAYDDATKALNKDHNSEMAQEIEIVYQKKVSILSIRQAAMFAMALHPSFTLLADGRKITIMPRRGYVLPD